MKAPLETTHLLFMTKKPLSEVFLSSDISNQNSSISTTTSYKRAIPRAGANPITMTGEISNLFALIYIPHLHFTILVSYC